MADERDMRPHTMTDWRGTSPSPLDAFVEKHQPTWTRFGCRCGWQGDVFTVHLLDALRSLPVEERMAAMGMRRVLDYDDPSGGHSDSGLWVEA